MRNFSVRVTCFVMLLGSAELAWADAAPQMPSDFPAASRFWYGAEYEDALALIKKEKAPLPSIANSATEPYFRRLISADNLAIYKSQTISAELRAKDYGALYQAAIELFSLYARANHEPHVRATEVADMSVFLMQASATGVSVLSEYLATIPHGPDYDARSEHLKRTWMAFQGIVLGSAKELGETDRYSPSDRSYVLAGLASTLPQMIAVFQPDFKAELRARLTAYRSQYNQGSDNALLEQMITQLDAQQGAPAGRPAASRPAGG